MTAALSSTLRPLQIERQRKRRPLTRPSPDHARGPFSQFSAVLYCVRQGEHDARPAGPSRRRVGPLPEAVPVAAVARRAVGFLHAQLVDDARLVLGDAAVTRRLAGEGIGGRGAAIAGISVFGMGGATQFPERRPRRFYVDRSRSDYADT